MTRSTFRYADDGVYLERMIIETAISGIGQTTTLTSTSPLLLVPAGARTGTRTTGILQSNRITAAITLTISSIADGNVVADLVADLTGDVEGRQTTHLTARTSDLMTVAEVVDSDVRSGGIQIRTAYTARLR